MVTLWLVVNDIAVVAEVGRGVAGTVRLRGRVSDVVCVGYALIMLHAVGA